MFRCQLCRQVVPAGTPCHRVVIQSRPARYPSRSGANRVRWLDENGKHKEKYVDDPGGLGREIAREVIVCPACAGPNGTG